MAASQSGLFSETQHFRQWWLILLLVGIVVVSWGVVFSYVVSSALVSPDFGLSLLFVGCGVAFGVLLPLFILMLGLETRVDAAGVHFRFAPWQRVPGTIARADITSVEAIEYGTLTYGGYGIRMGRGLRVYNVSGHSALRFGLNSGNTVVIGTQHPLEFLAAVQTMLSST